MNKEKHYILDDEDIYELSLVSNPASKAKGLLFSEDNKDKTPIELMKFSVMSANELKHSVSGVFFPADKKIERIDENGQSYYVSMTKEGVFKMLEKYLRKGGSCVTVEHGNEEYRYFPIMEAWIIDSESTLSPLYKTSLSDMGLTLDVAPVGTACVTIFIDDIEFWEKYVTNGMFSFSIGGYFNLIAEETMDSDSEIEIEEPMSEPVSEPTNEPTLKEDFHETMKSKSNVVVKSVLSDVYKYMNEKNEPISGIVTHEFKGITYKFELESGYILGVFEDFNQNNDIQPVEEYNQNNDTMNTEDEHADSVNLENEEVTPNDVLVEDKVIEEVVEETKVEVFKSIPENKSTLGFHGWIF